jgi:polyhydroxyalkanoate synthesis regulator phasin|nr:MAG TPA: hypothetical protein [Caudoviricetes sp.]
MARPIQNTPTLEGEDAKKFMSELLQSFIKEPTTTEKEAKKKEMEEMEKSYSLLVEISGGAFY